MRSAEVARSSSGIIAGGHRPPDELLGRPAEDALRRRVPDGDRPVERERLGRERRRVDDRRQQRARPLEPGLRGVRARRSPTASVERHAQAGGRAPAEREGEGDEGGERRDGDARRGAHEQDVRRADEHGQRHADDRDDAPPRSTPAAAAPSRASPGRGRRRSRGATTATAMPSGRTAPATSASTLMATAAREQERPSPDGRAEQRTMHGRQHQARQDQAGTDRRAQRQADDGADERDHAARRSSATRSHALLARRQQALGRDSR